MLPVESSGASALARGSPSSTQHSFSARSGAQKANAIQSGATANAAAPVETARAVAQSQTTQKTLTKPDQRPLGEQAAQQRAAQPAATSARLTLAKPMTAVLLHELRLQQELADVQEQKGKQDK